MVDCGMFVVMVLFLFSALLLCITCVLTPSGRGIAAGRLEAGPSTGGGAGCSRVD